MDKNQLFIESIDRLGKITGETAVCEAVKELFRACVESVNGSLMDLSNDSNNIQAKYHFYNTIHEDLVKLKELSEKVDRKFRVAGAKGFDLCMKYGWTAYKKLEEEFNHIPNDFPLDKVMPFAEKLKKQLKEVTELLEKAK